jgi:hypothetical protein
MWIWKVYTTYPSFFFGIDIKDGKIDELENKTNTIDGNNQDAIWMHKRHSIEYPKCTIQDSSYVWIRLELFHILLLYNFIESWTATHIEPINN